MRRVLLSLLVLAAVAACEKKSSTTETTSSADGKTKVAFLLSTLQEERYQKDKKYFEEKATALGLAPFTLAADNDNAKQLAQVEDALSRGAKVLVIQPTDSVAAASYVSKAHAKGAKVIAYDRSIKSDDLDVYVSHDAFKVGVIEAQEAVKAAPKGNYVILDGQSGHSVVAEIDRGYRSVLDPLVAKGDIKIVVQKNHESWSPAQALDTTNDAIAKTKGDIVAILANNSGMARGAVQAVTSNAATKDKKIFIAGSDADAANANWVCEGKQSIEVLKDIKPLAEKAAETAQALASGKAPEGASGKPPTIAIGVHLITKDNAKKMLVDSGFHPAASVSACK
jgi:D-xylose transport system substrate-binding protein